MSAVIYNRKTYSFEASQTGGTVVVALGDEHVFLWVHPSTGEIERSKKMRPFQHARNEASREGALFIECPDSELKHPQDGSGDEADSEPWWTK